MIIKNSQYSKQYKAIAIADENIFVISVSRAIKFTNAQDKKHITAMNMQLNPR